MRGARFWLEGLNSGGLGRWQWRSIGFPFKSKAGAFGGVELAAARGMDAWHVAEGVGGLR